MVDKYLSFCTMCCNFPKLFDNLFLHWLFYLAVWIPLSKFVGNLRKSVHDFLRHVEFLDFIKPICWHFSVVKCFILSSWQFVTNVDCFKTISFLSNYWKNFKAASIHFLLWKILAFLTPVSNNIFSFKGSDIICATKVFRCYEIEYRELDGMHFFIRMTF